MNVYFFFVVVLFFFVVVLFFFAGGATFVVAAFDPDAAFPVAVPAAQVPSTYKRR